MHPAVENHLFCSSKVGALSVPLGVEIVSFAQALGCKPMWQTVQDVRHEASMSHKLAKMDVPQAGQNGCHQLLFMPTAILDPTQDA